MLKDLIESIALEDLEGEFLNQSGISEDERILMRTSLSPHRLAYNTLHININHRMTTVESKAELSRKIEKICAQRRNDYIQEFSLMTHEYFSFFSPDLGHPYDKLKSALIGTIKTYVAKTGSIPRWPDIIEPHDNIQKALGNDWYFRLGFLQHFADKHEYELKTILFDIETPE